MSLIIDLLVPVELLPEEGADVPPFESESGNGAASHSDLLKHYLNVTGDSHLRYRVSEDGIEATAPANGSLQLQHSRFGMNGENGGQPWFDLSASSTDLDLSPVLEESEGDPFCLEEDADAEECLRFFLEPFTAQLSVAVRGYAGTAIPVLRSWEEEGAVVVQFCGVILADEALLAGIRESGGNDGAVFFDESLGVVLEEPEIEGRGIREMAVSLAVLGVVLSGAPAAEAGIFEKFKIAKEERKAEKSGVVQVVANQHQAPAKVDRKLLQNGSKSGSQVIVDVGKQRAYVLIEGQIAIDTPVSTARSGKYTPRGTFKITQRVETGKKSTIYGCDLPYWMRLGESAIGMHIGDLPGYPASAGCVRLPHQIAPLVFEVTQSGTTVKVVDSWEPPLMVASL